MKYTVLPIFYLIFLNGAELRKSEENELIPRDLAEKLKSIEDITNLRQDNIDITINDYADKIFVNIQKLIISRNLNSVKLPDTTLKLKPTGKVKKSLKLPDTTLKLKPTGKVDLTAGYLQDLETVSRAGDIIVSYDAPNKKLKLVVPMKFGDLRFSYNFHSKVTFISSHGVANGTVKNIKVNAELSFEFQTNQAALDHYDMKHTGDINVKFHGNKIVDWLLNAMTKVFTVFFHPLIVGQIQKLIRENLRMMVDQLNELIHQIIGPNIM